MTPRGSVTWKPLERRIIDSLDLESVTASQKFAGYWRRASWDTNPVINKERALECSVGPPSNLELNNESTLSRSLTNLPREAPLEGQEAH
jgi:hypothetical protein